MIVVVSLNINVDKWKLGNQIVIFGVQDKLYEPCFINLATYIDIVQYCFFYFIAGKSPFNFADENHLLEDGSVDQTVQHLSSPSRGSPSSQSGVERIERFSRKVFVGGLPPDIDEGQ